MKNPQPLLPWVQTEDSNRAMESSGESGLRFHDRREGKECGHAFREEPTSDGAADSGEEKDMRKKIGTAIFCFGFIVTFGFLFFINATRGIPDDAGVGVGLAAFMLGLPFFLIGQALKDAGT